VVSIARFSTPACPDLLSKYNIKISMSSMIGGLPRTACFRFLIFHPFFPGGGSADPICPYLRTPMAPGTPCTKGSLVLVKAVVSKTGRNQHKAAGALACALRFSDVAATVSTWIRRVMYGKTTLSINRKDITYRNAARRGPSHGHG